MESVFAVILSAIVATLFMVAVMFTFSWPGFRHGDMISVVGSDLTRKPRKYFSRGVLLYAVVGLVMAPVYYMVLSAMGFVDILTNIGFAAFMGFSQGFIVMHLLIEDPAVRRPVKIRRKFFIPVSVAHWLGHMTYGAALGAMLSSWMLHGFQGVLVSGLVVMVLSLIISFFVKRGAHKQAVLERVESHG